MRTIKNRLKTDEEVKEIYAIKNQTADFIRKHINIKSQGAKNETIYLKHAFVTNIKPKVDSKNFSFEIEMKSLDVSMLIWTLNEEVDDTVVKWKCLDEGHDELFGYNCSSDDDAQSIIHYLHTVNIEYLPDYVDDELQIRVEFFTVSFEEITPIIIDKEVFWVNKYPPVTQNLATLDEK